MVFLEGQVQPDKVSDMKSSLAQLFPDTRKYDGNEGIDAYFNLDDPANMVMVEKWKSLDQYEKYLKWRTETGVMDQLGSMLVGPPHIRQLERTDA